MGLTALDTSAVVGFLDADDVLHPAARAQVLEAVAGGDRLGVPLIAWAEALTGVRLGHAEEAVLRTFRTDLGVELLSIDEAVVERAADLRVAGLRLPDALVLASAERADANRVLTGDRRWASLRTRVEVTVLGARGQ